MTICEQLRRVYDSVYPMRDKKLKEEITEKLVDAFTTAKKWEKDRNIIVKNITIQQDIG